jgi:hypothetical protein
MMCPLCQYQTFAKVRGEVIVPREALPRLKLPSVALRIKDEHGHDVGEICTTCLTSVVRAAMLIVEPFVES